MSEPCNGGRHCQEGVEGEKRKIHVYVRGGQQFFINIFVLWKNHMCIQHILTIFIRHYCPPSPSSAPTSCLFFIIVVIDSSLSLISTTHIPHSAWGYSHPLGDEQPASGQIPKGEWPSLLQQPSTANSSSDRYRVLETSPIHAEVLTGRVLYS